MFFLIRKKKNTHMSQSGFSLIELIVTIAIMVLVTSVVMVKHSSSNNVVLLKAQAFELALDFRAAQAYGVGVKRSDAASRHAYGISVDSTAHTYSLFWDINADPGDEEGVMDSGEQIGDEYIIDSGFFIADMCIVSGSTRCLSTVSDSSMDVTSATFKRPDFDARIANADGSVSNVDYLEITIASVSDSSFTNTVRVYSSGQISVQ